MGKFREKPHGKDKGKGISLERFAAGKVRGANKKTSKSKFLATTLLLLGEEDQW